MSNKYPKNLVAGNRGSALILTIIVLVNALLIVTTITTISIVEQKASSRTRNSTPAFQAADSTMEWALKKLQDSSITQIDQLCTGGFDGNGKCTTPAIGLPLGTITEIYFIDSTGEVITAGSEPPDSVVRLRTVGRFGDGENKVSRALEANLGSNGGCLPGFEDVADFCIQVDEAGTDNWVDAATDCLDNHGARLCRPAEWFMACQLYGGSSLNDMIDDDEWVDDITSPGNALMFGNGGCSATGEDAISSSQTYRCCMNK